MQDIVDRILAVAGPEKIVLYGSRARQANDPLSDFDLALFGRVEMGKIWASLEEAKTLLNIDVVAFDEARDEKFKRKILEEGVIIYERKV